MPSTTTRLLIHSVLALSLTLPCALPAVAEDVPPTPLEQARDLAYKQQYKQATQLLVKALQAAPRDPALLSRLAWVYAQWGRTKQAIAHYEQALELSPTVEAWLELADAYKRGGVPDKAEAAFRKAIAADPARADAYEALANFHSWDRRRPQAALAVLEEGIRKAKEPARLQRKLGEVLAGMGRFPEAVAAYQQVIAADPDQAGWVQDALAGVYIRAGDFDRAWATIRAAHRQDERAEYNAWMAYGWALAGEYRQVRAAAAFQRAALLLPSEADPYQRLALLASNREDYAAAEAALKQGLQAGANRRVLQGALADLYLQQKRYEEARRVAEEIAAAAPDDAEAPEMLGRVLAQMGREDEALAAFRRANKGKEDPEGKALAQLANVYQMASFGLFGDTSSDTKAAAVMARALARQGQDPALWRSLAVTYVRLGRYDEALAAFRKHYELKEDPEGMAEAYQDIARNRISNIDSGLQVRGLVLVTLFAHAVPDEMLQPFRDDPGIVAFIQMMEGSRPRTTMTREAALQAAVKDLVAATKQFPDNAELLRLLGDAHMALGRPAEALATWERVATMEGDPAPRAWALNRRAERAAARLLDVLGREAGPLWEEAQKYPEVAAGKTFQPPPSLAALLAARWPALKRQLQQPAAGARADAEQAVALRSQAPDYHISLARIQGLLEDWDGALRSLQKVLALAPDNEEAYKMLYSARKMRGDRAGARQALEQGVANAGGSMPLRERLIVEYLKDGQTDKAVAGLQDLIRVHSHYRVRVRKHEAYKSLLDDPRVRAMLE